MSEFEVGNVYSVSASSKKTFYLAIRKQTLIVFKNGKFCQYTTKKQNHVYENNLSVKELCKHWGIELNQFDEFMRNHFAPDPRGRKSTSVNDED